MPSSEFDIIRRYFTFGNTHENIVLGVGDDCALLSPPPGKLLATTTDTLVSGVHFPVETSAADIACKAIAVNISDLAAMAANPAWLSLALTLPEVHEAWLEDFSRAFKQAAQYYDVQLIGGDTTRGPLSITIQATGFVDANCVMRRDAAIPGDNIYVTGTIGDAALALHLYQSDLLQHENQDDADFLLSRLNRPEPRLDFALAVSTYARCAIDVSDGLLADLEHIISASQCGAMLKLEKLPLSSALLNVYANNSEDVNLHNVLSGGDDYELCFTAASNLDNKIHLLAEKFNLPVTKIGEITEGSAIQCLDRQGRSVSFASSGYQHF